MRKDTPNLSSGNTHWETPQNTGKWPKIAGSKGLKRTSETHPKKARNAPKWLDAESPKLTSFKRPTWPDQNTLKRKELPQNSWIKLHSKKMYKTSPNWPKTNTPKRVEMPQNSKEKNLKNGHMKRPRIGQKRPKMAGRKEAEMKEKAPKRPCVKCQKKVNVKMF